MKPSREQTTFSTQPHHFVAGQPEDSQGFFVRPAVEGTKNVLTSVLKHKDTVKRVVLTSSFAGSVLALELPDCKFRRWAFLRISSCLCLTSGC